jgi:hypothetical protein
MKIRSKETSCLSNGEATRGKRKWLASPFSEIFKGFLFDSYLKLKAVTEPCLALGTN